MTTEPVETAAAGEAVEMDVAAVLAQHQIEAYGMTFGSPHRCRCGAETLPEPGDEDVSIRRDRAFAAHQAAALATQSPVRVDGETDGPLAGIAAELSRLRELHVDDYIRRRTNHRNGDVDGEQIVTWDGEACEAWNTEYPDCAALIADAVEASS